MLFLVGHFDFFFKENFLLIVFSNENNLGFHMRYNFFRNFDDYPGPKQPFYTILRTTVSVPWMLAQVCVFFAYQSLTF